MTHPNGITLNRVWTEWATNYGVSSTVAAAVFLISEARPIHELTAKLAPDEFEQVAEIVSRWPDCFPAGTPAALKSRRQTPSLDSPAVSVSTDQEPRQRPVGTSPDRARERQAHVLSDSRPPGYCGLNADSRAGDQRTLGRRWWLPPALPREWPGPYCCFIYSPDSCF